MFNVEYLSAYETDGLVVISFNSFDIREWNATYRFDKENSEKFINELRKKYQGSFEEMFDKAFVHDGLEPNSYYFNIEAFEELCEQNGIKYEYSNAIIV